MPLQQLVDYGAGVRETQVKKAMSDLEKMEDMFFSTVRKSVGDGSNPLQSAWAHVLDKVQMKGSGTGAHATQTVEQLTDQAQATLREGRAMGLKTAQALLDSYAALASGVLIGMAQGMQAESGESEPRRPKPSAPNSGQPGVRDAAAPRLPCSPAAHAGPPRRCPRPR